MSIEMNPPKQHKALSPVMNQKVDRQVCLNARSATVLVGSRKSTLEKAHFVYSVRTPPMVSPRAAPTGAPAEKVANAMDRICEGGKVCARIPSWSR